MRQLLTPAAVTLTPQQTPATVSWDPLAQGQSRRQRRRSQLLPRSVVRIVDQWRYDGHWWDGEINRDYYLVEIEGGVRAELFREGDAWWLAKMSD